jgi:hypothetical protein
MLTALMDAVDVEEVSFAELCNFTPKQWAASDAADAHRFTLFGGARGPGKSRWLRWYPLRQLLDFTARNIHNTAWGLFCETYPELQDRQISKIGIEFPTWLGEVRDSKRHGLGFYFKEQYGGHVLLLRNLDDPDKYKSAEFAGLSIDEITRTPKRTFDILRGSLRWPGVERPQFCAASNPDGRYSEWVRQLWIERKFEGEGFAELQPLAHEFAFVSALPTDNPHLSEQYWQDLRTAPRHLREAWLDGSWYVRAEGIVYDEFDEQNITDDEPELDRPIELAFDDGYRDPRVVLFIQRSGTRVLVFDEIHETQTLDEVSVRRVVERIARLHGRDLPADAELIEGQAGMTVLERAAMWCRAQGVPLPEIAIGGSESVQLMRRFRQADIPARGGTHDIVTGINMMRGLICDGQGVRTLQVHRRCKNLIREMTQGYRYPDGVKRGSSEKPLDADNHTLDALRYWCHMRAR